MQSLQLSSPWGITDRLSCSQGQYAWNCQPEELTWALASRIFTVVPLHRHCWLPMCLTSVFNPLGGWDNTMWPKVLILNDIVRLCDMASPNLNYYIDYQFSQFSHSVLSDSLQPHGLQHARPPCPSPAPEVYSNSCPLSQWCHPTISSSVVPFSSCLQSFPDQGLFKRISFLNQVAKVFEFQLHLPMNIQDWFPLGWTGWISLQSKGLSRIFSNTAVQKHQFFGAQLSLYSNSHIHTWLLEKP